MVSLEGVKGFERQIPILNINTTSSRPRRKKVHLIPSFLLKLIKVLKLITGCFNSSHDKST